ncbi:SRPBCC family protein [Desulfobulbus rhabdoformis]|uniref:SRPBCC family protein n=1 Tax=Desulfobulbus rhabdoformis TaxID=34032 RepID=UPI001963BA29|nr:SRPBCC family protein [Desulfobulbus rhabdoformis]MBM9613830.1 SRPBCC family protein [Desulfobulbus rhabdoformis]
MKVLETQIQIMASKENVWDVLTDFEKFSEWNPFMRYVKGRPQKGDRIMVCLSFATGKE